MDTHKGQTISAFMVSHTAFFATEDTNHTQFLDLTMRTRAQGQVVCPRSGSPNAQDEPVLS